MYPFIIAVSLLNSSQFLNSVVFNAYDKIALMTLSIDANLAARGNFEEFSFDYEVIRDSTANFERNNMLGRGGLGAIYRL